MKKVSDRIQSIDILRGADLFLLLFLQPIIISLGKVLNFPGKDYILYQLDHEVWVGFRFWDLVMPLFLFLVGASMPFSFSKYRYNSNRKKVYIKIARRVIILFLLGMIVQGNLLSWNINSLQIYNNTLQAIAAGYLIAALILLNFNFSWQVVLTIALMIIYSIPMLWYGKYEPDDSFAFIVDKVIIGSFRGDLTYTWIWSSLTFGATVMMGAMAGEIIKKFHNSKKIRIVVILSSIGIVLIFSGLISGILEPIIKRLWTSSMTLYSGGFCMLLLGIVYFITDVLKFNKGLNWLKIYGTNAITAYCIGEVINFRSVVNSLTFGLQPIIPDWYPFILTFGNATVLFLILYFMYRYKIMIKI